MTPDDARALLQSTQQVRTHWSGVITTHIGYAIAVNVALWSFFAKAYVDSLAASSGSQPIYVGMAAAFSSLLLGLWRLYARYLDNAIAGLYADFLLYEGTLSVPAQHQTSGYLIRAVPNVGAILCDNKLDIDQRVQGIRELVRRKHIGRRGHLGFDLSVLFVILIMVGATLFAFGGDLWSFGPIASYAGIGIGLGLTIFEVCYYQKNPKKHLVQTIAEQLKSSKAA